MAFDDPVVESAKRRAKRIKHEHIDEQGVFHKCYHHCKNVLTSPAFWIGTTVATPLEHWLWFVGPLKPLAQFVGLGDH